MSDEGPMTMQAIRDAMEARLAHEKARLVAALARQLEDDSERISCKYGARGRMRLDGLPGMFYVNCNREGEPWEGAGRGKGQLSHYFWIPVVYRDGERVANYVLSLWQGDIDVNTGDVHSCFGRIQFTCPLYGDPGNGGQANPKPEPIDGGYLLRYRSDESFPRAVRACGSDQRPRTVLNDDRPWGYAGFEDIIPVLDLSNPAYDPWAVATFFIRLILRDLGV